MSVHPETHILHVGRHSRAGGPDYIEQYDTSGPSLKKLPDRIDNIPGLRKIDDFVIRSNCIYLADNKNNKNGITRISLSGQITSQWSVEGPVRGLSVNKDNNLIILSCDKRGGNSKILEYDGDGRLLRRINLPETGMEYSRHAVQLNDNRDQFAVCHGDYDAEHRVCVVDCSKSKTVTDSVEECNAEVIYFYGNVRGRGIGQLNSPNYIAVDSKNHIIVADRWNNRVAIFDFQLNLSHFLNNSFTEPVRVLVDESRDRLYVGEYTKRIRELPLNTNVNK